MNSSEARGAPEGDDALETILAILAAAHEVDFGLYRRTTIRRRVLRRMGLFRIKTIPQYAQFLKDWPGEVAELARDILIKVTCFFRDPYAFEALKAEVFPALLRSSARSAPIRVWVPGCSTGEEVYSIAISLIEALAERRARVPLQLFATDVVEEVIDRARAGVYGADIAGSVTGQQLRQFFTPYGEYYKINRSLREMCVFAKQNVISDPPFGRIDLISCRNLLIYLEPPIQTRILPTFYHALNPDGFLLLGASETVRSVSDLFRAVDKRARIYAKVTGRPHAGSHVYHLPGGTRVEARPRGDLLGGIAKELEQTRESLQALVDAQDAMIEELQCANEELATSNEELQSINEELMTAKEELQVTTMDHLAMNEILDRRNEELSQLAAELAGVLASIELAIVVLRSDLRIRRFTPSAERALKLSLADQDRPLRDVALSADIPGLDRLIAEVIDTGAPAARDVKDREGRPCLLRILPHRTGENRIDGAVLYLVDIDDLRRSASG